VVNITSNREMKGMRLVAGNHSFDFVQQFINFVLQKGRPWQVIFIFLSRKRGRGGPNLYINYKRKE